MKVKLHWHKRTREDVERWVRSLPGHDPERRAIAEWVIDELSQRLIASSGRPMGAIPIQGHRPPRFWWMGIRDVWILFSVEDEARTLRNVFRDRVRAITLWRMVRAHPHE